MMRSTTWGYEPVDVEWLGYIVAFNKEDYEYSVEKIVTIMIKINRDDQFNQAVKEKMKKYLNLYYTVVYERDGKRCAEKCMSHFDIENAIRDTDPKVFFRGFSPNDLPERSVNLATLNRKGIVKISDNGIVYDAKYESHRIGDCHYYANCTSNCSRSCKRNERGCECNSECSDPNGCTFLLLNRIFHNNGKMWSGWRDYVHEST